MPGKRREREQKKWRAVSHGAPFCNYPQRVSAAYPTLYSGIFLNETAIRFQPLIAMSNKVRSLIS